MTHATTTAAATEQPMSTFEQTFRLWLAGFGTTEEQCDKLCADRRIAMSIRLKDSGGLVQDLPDALRDIPRESELRKAVENPREKLMLMMLLK